MKQERLENLADGVFAIVMTLMVLEIKVPSYVPGMPVDFGSMLVRSLPYFLSYLLSFSVLYTYWQTHHFIASVYAKTIDVKLANINALFLFLIGLIPFSSHFLGQYGDYQFPVIFFASHIILTGFTLYKMRQYITVSHTVENEHVTKKEHIHSNTHILFPVFSAVLAIVLSFVSIKLALIILTIGIVFNLSSSSTRITFAILRFFIPRIEK